MVKIISQWSAQLCQFLRWSVSQCVFTGWCSTGFCGRPKSVLNLHQSNQLYDAVNQNEKNYNMNMLEKCSAAVDDWILHNGLALNPDKSVDITFGTSQVIAKSTTKIVMAAGSNFAITHKVKSLGVA